VLLANVRYTAIYTWYCSDQLS